MFSSDLSPLFHHENHREQGRGRRRGLKAGSNTMALRCYLCPLLCWREGVQRERKGLWELLQCSPLLFFFFLCWAGWLADGLVTSKMKMNAVKFACVNFLSLRWDLEHSRTWTGTFIHWHTYHRYTCMHAQWHARPCPAGFNHTPSACGESVSEECEASAWLKECVSNVHSHSLCCFGM